MYAARVGHRRLMTVLLALLVASALAYVVILTVTPPDQSGDPLPTLAYALPSLIASLLVFVRTAAPDSASRAWLLLALALVTDVVATLAYWVVPEDAGPWLAAVPDIIWLAFYPLALAFLLRLARRQLSLFVSYGWIDALVTSLTVVGVGLAAVIVGIDSALMDSSTVLSAAYLVGDFALLGTALVIASAFRFRISTTWWLLLSGIVLYAIADSVYFWQTLKGGFDDSSFINLLWPASSLLFGIAAYRDVRSTEGGRQYRALPYAITGASMLVAAATMAWMPTVDGHALVSAVCLVVVALGTIRLVLTMREAVSLGDQLSKAERDPLTGLPNMRALRGLSPQRVRDASLIFLDLHRFSEVNILLGHEAGDRVLILVADRMRDRLRGTDQLFRLGSDGFAVLLPSTDLGGAIIAAEGYIETIEHPMNVDGIPLHLTACGGVASESDDADTIDLVFRDADEALIRAKADGAGLVRGHAAGSGARSAERLLQRAAITEAFDQGGADFLVYYQPIVRLEDDSMFGVEALVRWRHEGEVLPPGAFMDDLVRVGAMRQLTRHMLTTSLSELRSADLDLAVAVNVAPELVDDDLVDLVRAALVQTGSLPHQLLLEVTEESLMHAPERAALVLGDVRQLGVRVELDDFGTGWSGLSSLRDLVVDGIKIDRSFVAKLLVDDAARAIVDGVSVVADELDLLIIFEGVEDPGVTALLKASFQGCTQGFGIGRPMPIDDLVRWLALRSA